MSAGNTELPGAVITTVQECRTFAESDRYGACNPVVSVIFGKNGNVSLIDRFRCIVNKYSVTIVEAEEIADTPE